jgi:hypothetical protein
MKRDEFEPVLRAAGAITGVASWVTELEAHLDELDPSVAARIRPRLLALRSR